MYIFLFLIIGVHAKNFIDLKEAVVKYPSITGSSKSVSSSIFFNSIVSFLVSEVSERTQVTLDHSSEDVEDSFQRLSKDEQVVISLSSTTSPSKHYCQSRKPASRNEAFSIFVEAAEDESPTTTVCLVGYDQRGLLFAVGSFLTGIEMGLIQGYSEPTTRILRVDEGISINSFPEFPLRGHRISYGSLSNCYDGWDVEQMEKYVRELSVFGTNQIEFVFNEETSPHFSKSQYDMIIAMNEIVVDSYQMEFSLYVPQSELRKVRWRDLVKDLQRVDAFVVPSGDPGDLPAKEFIEFVAGRAEFIHTYHPKARIWITCQEFNATELASFLSIVNNNSSSSVSLEWLYGVVYGPHTRVPIGKLRAMLDKDIPLRHYPDIGHGLKAEFPIPNWHYAYAFTEAREVVNPLPKHMHHIIIHHQQRLNEQEKKAGGSYIGFGSYSEGCKDDLNKMIWSALHWNSSRSVDSIVQDYSRFFFGSEHEEAVSDALFDLEKNWDGPIVDHEKRAKKTLQRWQSIEENVTAIQKKRNWRLQMHLYRAYYDAFTEERYLFEKQAEYAVLESFEKAIVGTIEVKEALDSSMLILESGYSNWDYLKKLVKYAEALYQSISMQLSVAEYEACSIGRGANLDTLLVPLNNKRYLLQKIEIMKLLPHKEQINQMEEILFWDDPGPHLHGFYDNLGSVSQQPHVVKGEGWENDPSFYASYLMGYQEPFNVSTVPIYPFSFYTVGQALYDFPLQMHYTGLRTSSQYILKIVYGGDKMNVPIKLTANEKKYIIHDFMAKPQPLKRIQFDVPRNATSGGDLTLQWEVPPGSGGNGRGNQVAEVMLLEKN